MLRQQDPHHTRCSYRGVGFRIEDDVAILDGRVHVLSDNVPKHPDAIEAILRSGPSYSL